MDDTISLEDRRSVCGCCIVREAETKMAFLLTKLFKYGTLKHSISKPVERRRRKAIGTVTCQPAAGERRYDSVQESDTEFFVRRQG